MRRTRTVAAAALAAALCLGGCGGSSAPSSTGHGAGPRASSTTSARPAAPAAGAARVAISNYAYAPASLSVKVGTRLTFVNHDGTAHTATASRSPGFDTGTIKAGGGSAEVTLTTPGTFSYICSFHPFMRGTITVTR